MFSGAPLWGVRAGEWVAATSCEGEGCGGAPLAWLESWGLLGSWLGFGRVRGFVKLRRCRGLCQWSGFGQSEGSLQPSCVPVCS